MQMQNSTENPPFAEKIDINRFYPGAGRGALLVELHNAIVGNVPFITIIGDEGSGKSFLCELVASKLPSNVKVVTIPAGIESFEDILKLIVQQLGVVLSAPNEQTTIQEKLDVLQSWLEEHDVRLLVVFDDAETIYLATLERTRKNIEKTNKAGNRFTLLLSGRPMLMENLKQLSMCNFDSFGEKHFNLSAMNADDTYDYLNFSVEGEGWAENKEVFSREASDKIFDMAAGNFRMTNILAEEALQNVDQDTSFMVLLDNVRDKEDAAPVKRRLNLSGDWWKQKKTLQIAGGVAGVFLLLFLLLPGEKEELPQEKKEVKVVVEKKTVAKPVDKVKKEQPVKQAPVKVAKVEKKDKVVEKPAVKVEKKPEKKPVEQPKVVEQPKKAPVKEVVKKEKSKLEQKVEKKGPQKTQPVAVQPAKKEPAPGKDKYDERVVAGVSWLHGAANDKYTVQLMVLTSENAEENLRKILKEKGYQSVVDNMYILQKMGADAPILVFYGEYPSMSAARNARNTLPKILRKHNPYAISVEGAVHKAQ